MDRQTRIAEMTAALDQLWDDAFAIFSDGRAPDNYVQVTSDGVLEVTSRDYGGSLPRLTADQVDAIVRLGFDRKAAPNHRRSISMDDPAAIAALCEEIFAILGSPPNFDLEVVVDG